MEEYDNGPTEAGQGQGPKPLNDFEILDLLKELREESDTKSDNEVRDIARQIEQVISDKPVQKIVTDRIFGADLSAPRVTKQILDNLIIQWSNLITKDRPSAYCTPQNPSNPLHVAAAKTGTAFIEFFENEQRTAEKFKTSALYAATHGTGFIKIIMDPGKRKVTWTPLTIFDVFIENTNNKEDIKWCLIRSYIDKWEAKKLIQGSDPEYDGTPATTSYKDGAGGERKGVEKWEIWHLPSARYEKGLYACVIGNKVVEYKEEYPYTFDDAESGEKKAMLPVVYWKCRPIHGMSLGETWANKCISLQVALNALFSRSVEDSLLSRRLRVVDERLRGTDLLDLDNATLYLPDTVEPTRITYLSPPPIDPNNSKGQTEIIQALHDAAGISPSTMGNAAPTQSGRALAYQAELDTGKHAISAASLESAIQEAWELTLKLVQKFYTVATQIEIAGEDLLAFSGSDIQGVTVKLEARSERESATSVKLETAQQQVAAGIAQPNVLTQISPTIQSAGFQLQAKMTLDRLLAGEDVNIGPETIAPEIMLEEIDRRINYFYLRQDIAMVDVLTQLKNQLLLDLNSAQSPEQEAAPTQPQPQAPLPEQMSQEFPQ